MSSRKERRKISRSDHFPPRHGPNKSGNNNSPVTARKGCNWKNKILIEFVTRAFPSCFDRKTLCSNQSNFALLLFLLSVHWTQSQSMQSLEDHSRKYEITTDIIVVYFTHCSRKINNMFIIDRNVTAFAQCQELIFHLIFKTRRSILGSVCPPMVTSMLRILRELRVEIR